MKVFTKLFTSLCQVCPLCIIARRFPASGFARGMKRVGKVCPFCIAYRKSAR
jgi:hypothetical protein